MKKISISKHEKHCLKYLKKSYNLSFLEPGMIVKYKKEFCTVIGFSGAHILIATVGNKKARICHPTWNMTYYDKYMNIIACFADEQGGTK